MAQLDITRIQSILSASQVGHTIRYVPIVDSTNRLMRAQSPEMRRHGQVILAEHQVAGRGRRGRRWTAPYGSSVLMSVALDWPERARAGEFSMVAGVAVAEAIKETTGLAAHLKWPNDVLLRGRKVCGILVEGDPQSGVVLGIGLNVNVDPVALDDLGRPATSLATEAGRAVEREDLVIALCNSLDLWYGTLVQNSDTVFTAWSTSLKTVGSAVIVEDSSGCWQGAATGVLRDGGLVVRAQDGTRRTVYAADVSIRDFTEQ